MAEEADDLQAQADALVRKRDETYSALIDTAKRYTDALQAFWNMCFTWKDMNMIVAASFDPQLQGFGKEMQKHLVGRNERLKQVQEALEEAVYAMRQLSVRSYHLAQKAKERRASGE